jgi:lipopolysaccharide export system protein LptA
LIRRLHLLIRALLVSALPAVAWAAYEAPPEAAALRIGVAPFQVVSPPDVEVPDLADSLAQGLQAQGLERIVGPDALGAPRIAEPAPGLVRSLAARAGVDALLVGRTTRLGNRLSVDVRLRSGLSGVVAGTYVAEVSASEPLAPALDRLVEQVVVGALALAGAEARSGPVAPGVLGRAVPAQPPIMAASSEGAPFGFGNLAGSPISIRSDELEATDSDGVRTLIFRQNVEVRQADLFLGARYLEARYRDGSKQPDRLVARGDVLIRQGEREGRCAEAFYDHPGQRIVCRGDAELRDGADRVSGESIAFDLVRQRVSVEGGADLLLHPTPRKDETTPGQRERQVGLESDEPVAIRAERLDAEERGDVRLIVLEGDVVVVQSDVELRAARLEAGYPIGAQRPDRLTATGDVEISQGERQARCERAVYSQPPRRVECEGNAEMWDGRARVRGDVITLDLDAETVDVTGRTRLVVRPADSEPRTALP